MHRRAGCKTIKLVSSAKVGTPRQQVLVLPRLKHKKGPVVTNAVSVGRPNHDSIKKESRVENECSENSLQYSLDWVEI